MYIILLYDYFSMFANFLLVFLRMTHLVDREKNDTWFSKWVTFGRKLLRKSSFIYGSLKAEEKLTFYTFCAYLSTILFYSIYIIKINSIWMKIVALFFPSTSNIRLGTKTSISMICDVWFIVNDIDWHFVGYDTKHEIQTRQIC